jgi:hypothetical protein
MSAYVEEGEEEGKRQYYIYVYINIAASNIPSAAQGMKGS